MSDSPRDKEGGQAWRRHPADLARLLAALVAIAGGLGVVAVCPGTFELRRPTW
ncbi:MAG: hypothetical protein H6519_04250 [Microthrixaceae bacterium]|nr:hypothetical protein [Microthrixaceae bacterium]